MKALKITNLEKKLSNTKVINSYQSFSDDDRAAILQLFNIGCSSREICSEMGWKRSRKSSVNMFLKPYRDGNLQVDSNGVSLHSKERKSLNGVPLFEVVSKEVVKQPKILFYDIETTLAKSYHFQQWKVNLSQKQKIQESHLLSHAWAWGDGSVSSSVLTPEEVLSHDPERLVLEAWSLVNNCDVLVAHNAKRFDVKKINSYFLQYGLPPPAPYKVVDTLQIAKNKFALPFNSLAYLAEFLGVEQKIDTGGIDLWISCDKGDPEALKAMENYNIGDITTLRGVYNKIIGWDNNAVNMSLYDDEHDMLCPHCSSDRISSIEGKFVYTVSRKYSLYRCDSCGATLRGNRKEGNGNKLVRVG